MPRELERIDQPGFRGWGCSQCAWIFNPTGPPNGETFTPLDVRSNSNGVEQMPPVLDLTAAPFRKTLVFRRIKIANVQLFNPLLAIL
jgi:hypothetical protein